MFDEVEGSTGTKDATDLAHGGNSVGNGAQRPGRQRRVYGVVLKLQGLAVQTDEIDRHVTLGKARTSELSAALQWVDRQKAVDRGRQVRKVESSAEPDLEHLADERRAHVARMRRDSFVLHTTFITRGKTLSP